MARKEGFPVGEAGQHSLTRTGEAGESWAPGEADGAGVRVSRAAAQTRAGRAGRDPEALSCGPQGRGPEGAGPDPQPARKRAGGNPVA